MQFKQHRGNMTVFGCMSDKWRCGILKTLQFVKMHSWYTLETTVAIINACHAHALNKQFGGSRRQEVPCLSDIMQLIVDLITSLVNLFCHLKVNVKTRTKVADVV